MNLLKIARTPPVVVAPDESVAKAIEKMVDAGVGAVAVVEGDKLIGIFTERDVMNRVVYRRLSALDTPVKDVMTTDLLTISPKIEPREALESMSNKHYRHLPIVDKNGKLLAMLSVRHLMHSIAEYCAHELDGLSAYIASDGIGGD